MPSAKTPTLISAYLLCGLSRTYAHAEKLMVHVGSDGMRFFRAVYHVAHKGCRPPHFEECPTTASTSCPIPLITTV
jgi:hypothetical protein